VLWEIQLLVLGKACGLRCQNIYHQHLPLALLVRENVSENKLSTLVIQQVTNSLPKRLADHHQKDLVTCTTVKNGSQETISLPDASTESLPE
jgi:hypothetical protein